jgi:hypothetical protein
LPSQRAGRSEIGPGPPARPEIIQIRELVNLFLAIILPGITGGCHAAVSGGHPVRRQPRSSPRLRQREVLAALPGHRVHPGHRPFSAGISTVLHRASTVPARQRICQRHLPPLFPGGRPPAGNVIHGCREVFTRLGVTGGRGLAGGKSQNPGRGRNVILAAGACADDTGGTRNLVKDFAWPAETILVRCTGIWLRKGPGRCTSTTAGADSDRGMRNRQLAIERFRIPFVLQSDPNAIKAYAMNSLIGSRCPALIRPH